MKIAIVGAGNVGATLGAGWNKAGHTIIYGVRNASDQKYQPLTAHAEVKSSMEAGQRS